MAEYLIPAEKCRAEIKASNSRFIAMIAPAFSVDEAKSFIRSIRREYPDASHHVPAFVVGHGASVIAHCTDDGEPAGSAGRPALAVLQGSGLGDAVLVIVRYFGGTKLGVGGLVRAYSDAARAVLAAVPRAIRTPTHTVMLALPYTHLERVRRLIASRQGQVLEEDFAVDVTITAQFPVKQFGSFQTELREISHGSLAAEIIETSQAIMPYTTP